MDGIVQRLREHNVTLQSGDAKIEVRPGLFVVYAVDPEGNFLEFLEVPDVTAYRPDLFKHRQRSCAEARTPEPLPSPGGCCAAHGDGEKG